MIIGIAIAIVFMLIATLSVTYYWIRKRRSNTAISKTANQTTQQTIPISKSVPLTSILNGQSPIPSEDEFHKLTKYEDGLTQRVRVSQGKRYNKTGGFNMAPENLPFDHNRVKLRTPIEGCDYVNASWINNPSDDSNYDELIYTTYLPFRNIRFIIGQDPMDATMQHHYRMLLENRVDVILCFSEDNIGPDNLISFEIGRTYNFGELSLAIRSRRKITDHLLKAEITIIDTTASGVQNIHHANYFAFLEFDFHGREITCSKDAEKFIVSICTIRNELKSQDSSLKVFVHDCRGGVKEAAAFVVLYELMQQIDESLTEENEIKRSAANIDVFKCVNRLRKDRSNAIEDYTTYKDLFLWLNYYGPNRRLLNQRNQRESENTVGNRERRDENRSERFTTSTHVEEEIEYVLHDPNDELADDMFSDYYDNGEMHPTYQNI